MAKQRYYVAYSFEQKPIMPVGTGVIEVLADDQHHAVEIARNEVWRQNFRDCGLDHVIIGRVSEYPETDA